MAGIFSIHSDTDFYGVRYIFAVYSSCTAVAALGIRIAGDSQAIFELLHIWPQAQRVVLVLPDFGQLERDFYAWSIPVAEGGADLDFAH